ncbi:hypothetical protein RJT34_01522 [Clitoria ternatea]|uniref:Uncharacterized protein n=1 Tax=Clitoria ternatea TaxID=43366 RepID=A0AAN9PZW3_CLITE
MVLELFFKKNDDPKFKDDDDSTYVVSDEFGDDSATGDIEIGDLKKEESEEIMDLMLTKEASNGGMLYHECFQITAKQQSYKQTVPSKNLLKVKQTLKEFLSLALIFSLEDNLLFSESQAIGVVAALLANFMRVIVPEEPVEILYVVRPAQEDQA